MLNKAIFCISFLSITLVPLTGAVSLPQSGIVDEIREAADDLTESAIENISEELDGTLADDVGSFEEELDEIVNAGDIADDLAEFINGLPSVQFACGKMPGTASVLQTLREA